MSIETLCSRRVNAHLVAGVVPYLSYMSVRTSRVCICRHQEKHIRLHSHSACYTPLKQINNYYVHFEMCPQSASYRNSNLHGKWRHSITPAADLQVISETVQQWALHTYHATELGGYWIQPSILIYINWFLSFKCIFFCNKQEVKLAGVKACRASAGNKVSAECCGLEASGSHRPQRTWHQIWNMWTYILIYYFVQLHLVLRNWTISRVTSP